MFLVPFLKFCLIRFLSFQNSWNQSSIFNGVSVIFDVANNDLCHHFICNTWRIN